MTSNNHQGQFAKNGKPPVRTRLSLPKTPFFGEPLEGAVTMRARSPKHPFLCDSRVPFQELIYWRFRSISIARRPFRSPFRSILIYSISIILIYFDHFDSFRFISIPPSESPKHFDGAPAICTRKTSVYK
jgi:hypothetical protein